jgi:hypothetical protein
MKRDGTLLKSSAPTPTSPKTPLRRAGDYATRHKNYTWRKWIVKTLAFNNLEFSAILHAEISPGNIKDFSRSKRRLCDAGGHGLVGGTTVAGLVEVIERRRLLVPQMPEENIA